MLLLAFIAHYLAVMCRMSIYCNSMMLGRPNEIDYYAAGKEIHNS
jgi:hypothetical protein